MPRLFIYVDANHADMDFIRTKAVIAVEDVVELAKDTHFISDEVEVGWDLEDD